MPGKDIDLYTVMKRYKTVAEARDHLTEFQGVLNKASYSELSERMGPDYLLRRQVTMPFDVMYNSLTGNLVHAGPCEKFNPNEAFSDGDRKKDSIEY
jgi:hypothetical protein